MMEKRVLVTGATGFIGRHAVPLLIKRGFEVHGLYFGDASPAKSAGCSYHEINALDEASWKPLLAKIRPGYLLHLAWEARPGVYWTSLANHEWAGSSEAIFREFYRLGGRRGVSAGTCAEYRWDSKGPCHEINSPVEPATLYGASKLKFARTIDAFARQQGLSFAWGRVFHTFGPGEHPRRLVPSVIRALIGNESVDTTDGRHVRDFLYVEDVAGAFAALLESDCAGPVNIAGGKGRPIADIVNRIVKILKKPGLVRFGARLAPDAEPAELIADTGRLRKETDFRPRFKLDEALNRTVRWWRERP